MPGPGRKPKKAGRARHGTGSIYWDKKRKQYVGKISLGTDANGKRIRPTFYGKTKREVQEQIDQAKKDALLGPYVVPERLTVAEHFDGWLRTKAENLAPTTFSQYEWRYQKHIRPMLGGVQLRKLDYRRIEAFYDHLRQSGLGQRTIYDIAALLRQGLEDAVKKGIVPNNQAKVAASPRVQKQEARFLNHQEAQVFLEAAAGEYLEEFFIVALHTGLRASELLGLTWDAVDLDGRKLTVRQAMHEVRGIMQLGDVKTQASRRTISLSQEAVAALRRQRKKQMATQLAAGHQWDNDLGLVFTNRIGGPLIRTNITKRDLRRILNRSAIIAAAKRYGYHNTQDVLQANTDMPTRAVKVGDRFLVPDGRVGELIAADIMEGVGIHTFRHTHASMLIAAGTDILTVSRRLGHENIRITLDLYGHLMPGQDEAAADAMDRLFRQA